MKQLIGKTIDAVFIDSQNQHYLMFRTDKGDIWFFGEGDCCSETYFSDIQQIRNLIGMTVLSVEDIDLKEGEYKPKSSRQNVDSVYGIKLYTERGICIIVYRNSSNGYYGGSCYFLENPPSVFKTGKMLSVVWDYSSDD